MWAWRVSRSSSAAVSLSSPKICVQSANFKLVVTITATRSQSSEQKVKSGWSPDSSHNDG